MSRAIWPSFPLDGALAARPHVLSVAFILALLVIFGRRLPTGSPRSCEGKIVSEVSISPSRTRHKAPAGLSLPGGDEHHPAQHTEEARPHGDPELKADEDEGKGRMTKRNKQPYEAFLVLDVEGTCIQGSGFGYPNEIIVRTCLLLGPHVRTDCVSHLSPYSVGVAYLPATMEG